MGFVHNFGETKEELNLGGRQNQYMRQFEDFLIKLKEAGASLAFFCDGQLQPDKNYEWCRRRDDEYKHALNIIDENINNNNEIKKRFGCKTIVKSFLKLVEDKNYGIVHISTDIECDTAIAKYAHKNNAMAIIASDSDFLIYEGGYNWWDANTINYKKMTAYSFDRKKFRDEIQLTDVQLKYFATIVGNDYTNKIAQRNDFQVTTRFCQGLKESSDYSVYYEIAKYMTPRYNAYNTQNPRKNIDLIIKSIKSYDVNYDEDPVSRSQFDEYSVSNVLMYAFLNEKVFQYEANFLDYKERCNNNNNNTNGTDNNYASFMDRLIDVFCKLGGILIKGSNYSNRNLKLKIVTKYSLYEKYTLKEHTPIYPKRKN